jgi:hypothetical protein
MKFEKVLEFCREGARIARAGWEKGRFVYYEESLEAPRSTIRSKALREWMEKEGVDRARIWGHFNLKTSNNLVSCGWLASQSDMQADDWEVV